MILFPAIDLKDGQCVRLELGDMDRATVFNADPAAQARAFEAEGFEWLHVVDLNGAFAGRSQSTARRSRRSSARFRCRCSSAAASATWRRSSPGSTRAIARVILGTVAVRDPALVRAAASAFPGRVAVGIDARGGKVAVEGWAEATEMDAIDLARRFEDAGVAAIIYTDIDRDGVLKGLNVAATLALARRRLDPGHRLRRPRLARRCDTPARARLRHPRRRHLRPGAL